MSCRRLDDGRWVVEYRDTEGRPRRQYFGRGDRARKLAQERDRSIRYEKRLARQDTPKEPGIKFETLATKYIEFKGKPRWLNSGLAPFRETFGNKRCAALTVRDVVEALPRTNSGPATRNRLAAYVRATLGWGVRHGYLHENPLLGLPMERTKQYRVQVPTEEEIKRILAVAPEHLRRAVLLAAYTGCRPGPSELFAVKWQDVDFERGTVTVLQGKTGRVKVIFIAEPLFRELQEWKKTATCGHVLDYRGRPMVSIKRAWATALRKAKIGRRIRPYDLRHWFATTILAAGGDMKATSDTLGHASPKMTADVYYGLVAGLKKAAVEKLPDLT